MTDDRDGEQLSFGVITARENNPSAPPMERGDCGELARPCPRTGCKHHLAAETERSGRPWHGKHNDPKLKHKEQSCTLDVTEANPDGMGYGRMGKLLHLTRRRAQQIGDRAVTKTRIAHAMLELIEEKIRPSLPEGVILDSVFPRQTDAGSILLTLVLVLPKQHP